MRNPSAHTHARLHCAGFILQEHDMRYPGFEVSEDLRQERREWQVQRIVWPLLYLLLLGTMLGLFGNGPLSTTQTGTAALQLEYQRFLRHRAPDTLQLSIAPTAGNTTVLLDRAYLQHIHIETVSPEPERVIAGTDAVRFVFHTENNGRDANDRAANGRATNGRAEIVFDVRPQKVGAVDGWIALEGQPRHRFTQFVYP
jgi:hypothetical protein